jgi:hypothetical protein
MDDDSFRSSDDDESECQELLTLSSDDSAKIAKPSHKCRRFSQRRRVSFWMSMTATAAVSVLICMYYYDEKSVTMTTIRNDELVLNSTSHTPPITHLMSLDTTILPGDLPTYTGWARPSQNIISSYLHATHWRISAESEQLNPMDSPMQVNAGQPLIVRVHCVNKEEDDNVCDEIHTSNRTVSFYVRAYGPSVLPGRVVNSSTPSSAEPFWDILVLPLDAGYYHLEVIVTFSRMPASLATSFPDPSAQVAYEGYPIAGGLLAFTVKSTSNTLPVFSSTPVPTWPSAGQSFGSSSPPPPLPWCTASQVLIPLLANTSGPDYDSATFSRGRWLVTNKASASRAGARVSSADDLDFIKHEYFYSTGSLGIQMEYVPATDQCRLPTFQEIQSHPEKTLHQELSLSSSLLKLTKPSAPTIVIHAIFIGDSNIRIQQNTFVKYFGNLVLKDGDTPRNKKDFLIRTTLIPTNGGLKKQLPTIKASLKTIREEYELLQQQSTVKVFNFILYNAGLHDIAENCNVHSTSTSLPGLCTKDYETTMRKFIRLINEVPAVRRVWQSTTASWPKYGVYGITWPVDVYQPLPKAPEMCHLFNEIAHGVLIDEMQMLQKKQLSGQPADTVQIMDAFWMTYSRPDHRAIDDDSKLPNKLMHAGVEVYYALTRQWIAVIVDSLRQHLSSS